jgi:hypothetical protein
VVERSAICVLLLPEPLERFALRAQAEDLLRADSVIAVDPPRVAYRAFARIPLGLGDGLAARQARRLVRTLRRRAGEPRVVVIFHALQYQLGRALIAQSPGCELWYWRSEREERAPSLPAAARDRVEALHEQAGDRAGLVICASDELARLEGLAGHRPVLVPPAADDFPAAEGGEVVAIALGPFGAQTDWTLVRAVVGRLAGRVVLLLAGEVVEAECRDDADYAWCRSAPAVVWAGAVPDAAAARLVLCADVALAPLKVDAFSDAGLPRSILQAARVGRRTVTPELAGVRTWEQAVAVGDGAEGVAQALLDHSGARVRADDRLREWALAQTARAGNDPLWQRLADAGIDVRVSSYAGVLPRES